MVRERQGLFEFKVGEHDKSARKEPVPVGPIDESIVAMRLREIEDVSGAGNTKLFCLKEELLGGKVDARFKGEGAAVARLVRKVVAQNVAFLGDER